MFISFGFAFRDIHFYTLIYIYFKINRVFLLTWFDIGTSAPSQMAPPASGAHGTCPACHTLDTPLAQQ
jgi:hypothetical protein